MVTNQFLGARLASLNWTSPPCLWCWFILEHFNRIIWHIIWFPVRHKSSQTFVFAWIFFYGFIYILLCRIFIILFSFNAQHFVSAVVVLKCFIIKGGRTVDCSLNSLQGLCGHKKQERKRAQGSLYWKPSWVFALKASISTLKNEHVRRQNANTEASDAQARPVGDTAAVFISFTVCGFNQWFSNFFWYFPL